MAKKKSFLMTPDPYHTPGYCGYVPQFKYNLGETFGSHTHKLLSSSDPLVASSGNPVLTEIFPSHTSSLPKTSEQFFSSPVYNRRRSWGDQKYVPQMVPGYTGYVPKGFHHFGARYAESCHYAISSFEADQHKHKSKMEELRELTYDRTGPQSKDSTPGTHLTTPLQPISAKAKPYLTSSSKKHHYLSPLNLPDDHPHKFYISGYSGFVPKSQKYLGQGYPIITCQALQEHTAEEKRLTESLKKPVTVNRPAEKVIASVGLYPRDTGITPYYTGYVPGRKFKFGSTYGFSTRDAVPILSVS